MARTMATERLAASITQPAFRLANRGREPNTARMKRFLKKLGISMGSYMLWSGNQPLNHFAQMNPSWTQRAWEVLILENPETIRAAA